MNVIRNLDDLERIGTLGHRDIVEFVVNDITIKYYVTAYYLETGAAGNDKIFNMLSIGNKREDMADKAYGYRNGGGGWPQYNAEDYAAATRLVKALYEIIENGPNSIKRIVFPNFDQT